MCNCSAPQVIRHRQVIHTFPNGYSASVVTGDGTYSDDDSVEVAILDRDGRIDYTTPITSDVMAYVPLDELDALLDRIAAL